MRYWNARPPPHRPPNQAGKVGLGLGAVVGEDMGRGPGIQTPADLGSNRMGERTISDDWTTDIRGGYRRSVRAFIGVCFGGRFAFHSGNP